MRAGHGAVGAEPHPAFARREARKQKAPGICMHGAFWAILVAKGGIEPPTRGFSIWQEVQAYQRRWACAHLQSTDDEPAGMARRSSLENAFVDGRKLADGERSGPRRRADEGAPCAMRMGTGGKPEASPMAP